MKIFNDVIVPTAVYNEIIVVCVDEFAGRRYAKLHGLEVIGTLGVLLVAKQKGYVFELRPLFQKLLANNRHIRKTLCNQILVRVGETEF